MFSGLVDLSSKTRNATIKKNCKGIKDWLLFLNKLSKRLYQAFDILE